MDILAACIGLAVFCLSAILLMVVAYLSIRDKSYEEIVAEQRQQASASAPRVNAKLKNHKDSKKQKKAGKKVKEKQSSQTSEKEMSEDNENAESTSEHDSPDHQENSDKHHVEFNEDVSYIVVNPEKEAKDAASSSKKRHKKEIEKEKVRPILVNKMQSLEASTSLLTSSSSPPSSSTTLSTTSTPPATTNHFEQIHPKDEFELKHSHSKDDSKSEPAVSKDNSNKQAKEQGGAKEKGGNKEKTKEQSPKTQQASKDGGDKEVNSNKHNKNKHSEKKEKDAKDKAQSASLNKQQQQQQQQVQEVPASTATQQVQEEVPIEIQQQEVQQQAATSSAAAPPQVNNSAPVPVSKDKKKKKNESNTMQIISDKQGIINLPSLLALVRKAELSRSEVQILIDLLLNKQHEAPAVIDEWTEGKADPVQKLKKQLAEKEKALADEQEALVGAQAKLREVRQEQIAERTKLQQHNRVLEETLQVKIAEAQALNTRIHGLNQKLTQMQTQINDEAMKLRQVVEENNVLQMRAQQITQAQEREIVHMQVEKENRDLKELHAQLTHHNNMMLNQVALLKSESDQKDECIRQLKEQVTDWERRMASIHRQEAEISQLKAACQQHIEEIRRLELGQKQMLDENRTILKQKDESEKFIAQLKADLEKTSEEKNQLEKAKLNGSAEESKLHQIELLNLHNELSSVKMQLQQNEKKYAEELDVTVKSLKTELEEQKVKNNELRQKNWKVMEALNAAESRNKSLTKASSNVVAVVDLPSEIQKAQKQEQDLHRKFLQRVFPDIKITDNLSQEEWLSKFEKAIDNYVKGLKTVVVKTPEANHSQEISMLQDEVERYKIAIEDSEMILKTLHQSVEREELNWRHKLEEKEAEIVQIRNNMNQQMHNSSNSSSSSTFNQSPVDSGVNFAFQCIEKSLPAIVDEAQSQVSNLQQQLDQALQAQQQLKEECKRHKDQQSFLAVEKLVEEVNRLKQELELEKNRKIELQHETLNNTTVKAQNHTSTNGTVNPAENAQRTA